MGISSVRRRAGAVLATSIAFTSIADAVMLNNTIANCHTLAEIAFGGALGAGILFAAHLVSKHTPLGEYARTAANAMGRFVYEGGVTLTRSLESIRRDLLGF